jgi:hypothetical protein
MHPRIALLVVLLVGGVIAGLAGGLFSFTLGSFLIWGALLGVALAVLSNFYAWPNIVGPLYGWAYLIALVVFLVMLVI